MKKIDRIKNSVILMDMMRTLSTAKSGKGCLLAPVASAVSSPMWHKSYNTFDSIQERSGEL